MYALSSGGFVEEKEWLDADTEVAARTPAGIVDGKVNKMRPDLFRFSVELGVITTRSLRFHMESVRPFINGDFEHFIRQSSWVGQGGES